MNEVSVIRHAAADVDAYRASTEAANICKEIVVATSSNIQGKRYVAVEGWQAIAIAHGCALSARDVEKVDGGVRAIGEVRRMSDGQLIATAEGFVGEDEPTWYGGDSRGRKLPKRADYAIRAMAQTRAMSRAGRTAFAHVVVMMNAGLATTPAEEMVTFDGATGEVIEAHSGPAPRTKLEGPYTSKTALKNAIHSIASAAIKATSVEQIDAAVKAGKEAIKQAERDWPELLTGDPSLEGDDEGLKRLVARLREGLTPQTTSLEYQLLVSTLRECQNGGEYDAWLKKNGDVIDSLDGAESRAFEAIHDVAVEVLKAAPTPMTAGAFGG